MKNFLSHAGVIAALLLALPLVAVGPCIAEAAQATAAKKKAEQPAAASTASGTVNVYEKQPPVTDKELLDFLDLLPQFRSWA